MPWSVLVYPADRLDSMIENVLYGMTPATASLWLAGIFFVACLLRKAQVSAEIYRLGTRAPMVPFRIPYGWSMAEVVVSISQRPLTMHIQPSTLSPRRAKPADAKKTWNSGARRSAVLDPHQERPSPPRQPKSTPGSPTASC